MPHVSLSINSGVSGLPPGTKESGSRVDFQPDDFALAIFTKGYRIAWSRAALCPCNPVNTQTQQPNPNCTLCGGAGWLYFIPAQATTNVLITGEMDSVQKKIVADKAAVIEGLLTGISSEEVPYDQINRRLTGTMNLTVRTENKLGYYDRITNLDSVITFTQVLEIESLTEALKTRYPIVQVNLVRSESKVFLPPADFTITDGNLIWNTGSANLPAVGDNIVVHYLCHPTWLVMEHPHATRMTPVAQKVAKRPTPSGEYIDLPIQAMVSYEFLVKNDSSGS